MNRVSCRRAAAIGVLTILCALLAAPLAWADDDRKRGQLYLVSLGIGDPDNITVRAQKTIAGADIVLGMERLREQYGELLRGKDLHEAGHGLFRPLGRRARDGETIAAQEAQVRRLVREAVAAGKRVAVIDYGDPTIYGPQIGYLREFADLDPVVVPGISSFNAANAALGRSLTDGDGSRSVILTAAAGRRGEGSRDTLEKLAETRSTLVLFTMRSQLPEVIEQLRRQYPGETPIAIVSHAGYAEREQVLTATLDTILERVGGADLPFEHLIYVGDFLR
ncbi:SAM-dependent methyltransferase [Thiococcus pfennigii]|uniref:SAM-dependent methyltransferase n=1 Tax=Thiococcus pfennigii TaxID=1057 RepID=UPI001905DFD7|nr:SAM-dependent methyltransferase [Thiococcus pfennigii]MBK1701649.1 tetrapyrrole methylase [Thiococcus pfennigii]